MGLSQLLLDDLLRGCEPDVNIQSSPDLALGVVLLHVVQMNEPVDSLVHRQRRAYTRSVAPSTQRGCPTLACELRGLGGLAAGLALGHRVRE